MVKHDTPTSFDSIVAATDLFLTVSLEGTGKCSISSVDFPSLALFFLKMSFVGRGYNKIKNHKSEPQTKRGFQTSNAT